jgi:amino acid transporter
MIGWHIGTLKSTFSLVTMHVQPAGDDMPRLHSMDTESTLQDAGLLEKLGYKQELYRGFTSFKTLLFSFTAVAVISSITNLFPIALSTGGPAVVVWSWIGASFLTIVIGLSMSEIGSAYPSAGSVYYWSARMAPPKWAPLIAFIDGWFNFIGNTAADAFFASAFASVMSSVVSMSGDSIYVDGLSTEMQVAVGICVLAIWSLGNSLRIDHQGSIFVFGAFFQVATTIIILFSLAIACPMMRPQASAEEVFFGTYNGTGFENFGYVSLIGLLSAFYCFTGYEGLSILL